MNDFHKMRGFTLFEMLLVLAIISSILLLLAGYLTSSVDETKRDKVVMQMEQILNAGMAYYINNSAWPTSLNVLKTGGYLPNTTITNPWGNPYGMSSNLTKGTFSVCTTVNGGIELTGSDGSPTYSAVIQSGIISGRLPMAYVVDGELANTGSPSQPDCTPSPNACNSTQCGVIATVNIPGQNLNNARSLNFAGVYRNGACVAAPVCPNPTTMTPAIFVVPTSVTGNYYGDSTPINTYPLNSFTAYAVPSTGPVNLTGTSMPTCTNPASLGPCTCASSGGTSCFNASTKYWRVCLNVVTQEGVIGPSPSVWTKNSGSIMVLTRCVPNSEAAAVGSDFTVFYPQ